MTDYSAEAEAARHRKTASRYYRRARADQRRAERYEGAAAGCDKMVAFLTEHPDLAEGAETVQVWQRQATAWRRLAETMRGNVPTYREHARTYRGLQRRYEAMAAEDAARMKEYEDVREG
jgi:hypothetical protein